MLLGNNSGSVTEKSRAERAKELAKNQVVLAISRSRSDQSQYNVALVRGGSGRGWIK